MILHALCDARPDPVDAVQSFPGSDAAGWSALTASGLIDGPQGPQFAPWLGCFVLRHAGLTILCDAGIGAGPNAYLGGLSGQLPQELARVGLTPDDIDLVLFTHLHMDHLGWASRVSPAGERVPMFPNAPLVAPQAELDFWQSGAPGARAHHVEAFETFLRPLLPAAPAAAGPDGQATAAPAPELPVAPERAVGGAGTLRAGVLTCALAGTDILPGLRFLAMPGHTPGHSAIRIDTASGPLVIAGDVFHCPGQVERPDWGHRADMDPDAARLTRQRFIAQAAEEGWLIAAGHFRDGLSFGRIRRAADGYVYQAEHSGPAA